MRNQNVHSKILMTGNERHIFTLNCQYFFNISRIITFSFFLNSAYKNNFLMGGIFQSSVNFKLPPVVKILASHNWKTLDVFQLGKCRWPQKIFKAAYTWAKPCKKRCISYINRPISSSFNISGDKILSKFKDKATCRFFVDYFVGSYISVKHVLAAWIYQKQSPERVPQKR